MCADPRCSWLYEAIPFLRIRRLDKCRLWNLECFYRVWLARHKEAARETELSQQRAIADDDKSKTRTMVSRKSDCLRLNETLSLKMPQLYHAANRIMNNYADSEDALQEALLAAFRHIDQFRGDSHLSTWLHTIVRNAALRQLQKRNRLREASIPDEAVADGERHEKFFEKFFIDSRPDPEETCAREERKRLLAENLKFLSPHCRSVVQLCIIDGLLLREAAEKLGVSTGAVKARLHRARRSLAKRI